MGAIFNFSPPHSLGKAIINNDVCIKAIEVSISCIEVFEEKLKANLVVIQV